MPHEDNSCIISRAELAGRLGISEKMLYRSLRWLEAFGYLKRETRYPTNRSEPFSPPPNGWLATRYTVVKIPTKADEHDVGVDTSPKANEHDVGAYTGQRTASDPDMVARVVRMYDEEKLSIRQIATRLGSSYGTVHAIVSQHTKPRPRGGNRRSSPLGSR